VQDLKGCKVAGIHFGEQNVGRDQYVAGGDININSHQTKALREQQATLRVYRGIRAGAGYARAPFIINLDGHRVGSIRQDEALEVAITPGRHTIMATMLTARSIPLDFSAASGLRVGVMARLADVFLIAVRPELSLVDYATISGLTAN
jgi:hypothetical protein